jgi:hypothetical protein
MISIDLAHAKIISHSIRRQKRAEEFEPLDQVIAKQIPGTDVQSIEAERQLIREKYAEIQTSIDDASDSDQLLTVIRNLP